MVTSNVLEEVITPGLNSSPGYAVALIIAMVIFVYLVYSLIKPEKF